MIKWTTRVKSIQLSAMPLCILASVLNGLNAGEVNLTSVIEDVFGFHSKLVTMISNAWEE